MKVLSRVINLQRTGGRSSERLTSSANFQSAVTGCSFRLVRIYGLVDGPRLTDYRGDGEWGADFLE